MRISASSENTAQELIRFTSNHSSHGGYWSAVRLVGWITQNITNKTTTLFFKWQRSCEKNNPYWNDSHQYTVTLEGQSRSVSFALGKASTSWTDMCSPMNITVTHDSTGAFTGTLSADGAKYWEAASGSVEVSFPTFSDSPAPTPEPDVPTPIPTDDNPFFYLYADGELLYANGLEDADGNRPFLVTDPILVLEINKSGSLTFGIPVTNEKYAALSKLKTNIEARQGNEVLFRGRIINDKRNSYNTKTVYCEGCLSYLYDSVQKPFKFEGLAKELMTRLFRNHNSQMTEDRQIDLNYSDVSANVKLETTKHEKTLKVVQQIIDAVGGYLVPYYAQRTAVMYRSSYSQETAQVIRFGENLIDFSEFIDASSVFTAVLPVGKDKLTISGDFVEDSAAVSAFGRIIEVVEFPDITDEASLRNAALTYLRTGIEAATTVTIDAVDLHLLNPSISKIRLGDVVRVVSAPHSIDAYFMCTKIKINMQDASKTTYTFGTVPKGITDLQAAKVLSRYVVTE